MTRLENPLNEYPGRPRPDWDSSREEQWQILRARIAGKEEIRSVPTWNVLRMAIAASLILLIVAGAFVRFYEVEVEVLSGEHNSITLPDGSSVEINAGTTISYHPYWWYVDREATLEGEAMFSVEHGSTFSIISTYGTTTVVGTKFNIYARDESYRVNCLEGKVRVEDSRGNTGMLTADQLATLGPDGFDIRKDVDAVEYTGWINNQFIFTDRSFSEVISEIERQFGIRIEYAGEPLYYTGSFTKEMDIDTILRVLTRPFGLKVISSGNNTYLLTGE